MSTQSMVVKSPTVRETGPSGLAIFCFIIGAPHIYGVLQSHHLHPQCSPPSLSGKKAVPDQALLWNVLAVALISGGCMVGLWWAQSF